jgi:hypothetical protein
MALAPHCIFRRGRSPIVAAAIHNGHDTRPDVPTHLTITDEQQTREEDPCTAEWSQITKTQIVGLRSRFEVDFNRPREQAVYRTPADAWGLEIWDAEPDTHLIADSLREYDEFYAAVKNCCATSLPNTDASWFMTCTRTTIAGTAPGRLRRTRLQIQKSISGQEQWIVCTGALSSIA